MAEILDNAAHLAQAIGPRPAGTEEERQAALYISEALQRKAGLPTEVEDFTCSTDFELPRAIYCLVAVLLTVLTFFLPVLVIVAFVITLIMAALYAVETLVRPVLAPMMSHGMSQNVVARYEPAPRAETAARGARQRKVVLLAHYDTGKVRAELKPALVPLLPIVGWAEVGAMALLALLLLLRLVSTPTGGFAVVITVLTAIACVVSLIPVAVAVMHRTAPYTDGANCNASGVAVMVEVAKRLKKGHERAQEMKGMEVRVHGEEAARESGLVPEGTTLSYEAQATEAASATAEDRLMAAKAAVAMLTGKPVSATVNIDLEEVGAETPALAHDVETLVAEEEKLAADAAVMAEAAEGMAAPAQAAASPDTADEPPVTFTLGGAQAAPAVPEAAAAMPTVTFGSPAPADDGVPDWFKAARAKARKSPGGEMPVSRSRYAEAAQVAQEAIDARNAELEARAAAAAESRAMTETEARLAQVRESIMEQHPARTAAPAPAPGAEVEALREEVSTVAFAPVEINGDELRREAQKQKEGERARTVEAAASAEPAAAAPAPQEPAAAPAVQEPAAAPAVDSAAEERVRELRKSIPLVAEPAAADAAAGTGEAPAGKPAEAPAKRKQSSEDQKARQNALRQILPSLSGSIKVSPDMFAKDAEEKAAAPSEKTDAFSPVEATRVFEPVTEATAEVLDEADIIEDADDSSYDGQLTETGAYTGREYVEMPQGRASRIFGRFRRGKKKAKDAEETSAAEWLDVEEGYDARERGEQLGEWSTRNHYGDGGSDEPSGAFADYDDIDDIDDYDDDFFADSGFKPRGWNGGVFSKESLEKVRGMVKKGGASDAEGSAATADAEQGAPAQGRPGGRRKRRAAGVDALFADTTAAAEPTGADRAPADEAAPAPVPVADPLDDVQAVHDFRLPDIGVEVWFVALGAELANNSGMKDFLATHRDELKGAIFVDLEALGAGSIASIDSEGTYFPVKPSSRMGRYARKAATALGIHVGDASMLWRDTAATVALRQGAQAMHFAGMKGDLPAYAASKDDKLENLSEDTMLANADFVVELLKQI